MQAVDRFGELVAGRYAVIAELQADHALRARHAIRLRGAHQEFGHDGPVADELAAHRGRRTVVHHVDGAAVAEVLLPRRAGQRVELIVNQVRAQRN